MQVFLLIKRIVMLHSRGRCHRPCLSSLCFFLEYGKKKKLWFFSHPASRAFLLLARFWRSRERLHESSKIFIEYALHVARIQS